MFAICFYFCHTYVWLSIHLVLINQYHPRTLLFSPAEIIHFSIRTPALRRVTSHDSQPRHINKAHIFVNIGKPTKGWWDGTFWKMNILWINHCDVYLAILHSKTWWTTSDQFVFVRGWGRKKPFKSAETKISDSEMKDLVCHPPPPSFEPK